MQFGFGLIVCVGLLGADLTADIRNRYSLLPRPDSDVMLMRLAWDGERCSGGVPQPLPESSSPLGTASSPIRTLSRLPSSTPLPSHRPHGNLEGRDRLCLFVLLKYFKTTILSFIFTGPQVCMYFRKIQNKRNLKVSGIHAGNIFLL